MIVLLADADLRHHRSARAGAGPRRSSWRAFAAAATALAGAARSTSPAASEPLDRPAVLPLDPVRVVDRHLRRRVRRVRRVPLPQHALPAGGPRPLAGRRPGSPPCRWPLMTVVASPLSGRIVGRRGPRLPLVIAGVCSVVACAMLTGIDPETPVRVAARGVRRSSGSASGSSTRRSRTPPCPGCRARRRASPRRSPRPRGSSARRSASRSSGRSSPPASAGRSRRTWRRRAPRAGGRSRPAAASCCVLGLVATSGRAEASARRTAARAQSRGARR